MRARTATETAEVADALIREAKAIQTRKKLSPTSGESLWVDGEINAASAAAFTRAVENAKADITVCVDSVGGFLEPALRVAAALKAAPGRVTAVLLKADSAALFLCLGADRVVAAKDCQALLHDFHLGEVREGLTAGDLEDAADYLRRRQSDVAALLGKRTGASLTFWGSLMKRGERLTAQQLKSYGLVDTILPFSAAHLRGRR